MGVTQGYLTYTYFVVDKAKETGYKVIVDAGNGKVLYTSEGQSMASFGSWKGHGVRSWHGLEVHGKILHLQHFGMDCLDHSLPL